MSDLCSHLASVPLSSTTSEGDLLSAFEMPLLLHNIIPQSEKSPFYLWFSSDKK